MSPQPEKAHSSLVEKEEEFPPVLQYKCLTKPKQAGADLGAFTTGTLLPSNVWETRCVPPAHIPRFSLVHSCNSSQVLIAEGLQSPALVTANPKAKKKKRSSESQSRRAKEFSIWKGI